MTAPFDRRHHQNRALTRREHPHMTDVTGPIPQERPCGRALPCRPGYLCGQDRIHMGIVTFEIRQARDAMTLQAAMQRRPCQVRDR